MDLIYTASYVMVLMRADPLQGQVGRGWALEIETFLGPVTWHRAVKRVQLRPQKIEISSARIYRPSFRENKPKTLVFYY